MNTSNRILTQQALNNMYEAFLDKSGFIPIETSNHRLKFAVSSMYGAKCASLLARYFNVPIELEYISRDELSNTKLIHDLPQHLSDEHPSVIQTETVHTEPIQTETALDISDINLKKSDEEEVSPIIPEVQIVETDLSACPKQKEPPPLYLTQLGMREEQISLINRCLTNPNGLILLTGQANSGKTTTMNSIILEALSKGLTIEDKINLAANLTSCIDSNLIKDTNIFFIDEIRDIQGSQSALEASLDHLVIAAINSVSPIEAIALLIEMDVKTHLLASNLILLIGQRLIRTICQRCRYLVPMEEDIKKIFSKIGAYHAFCEFSNTSIGSPFDPEIENELITNYYKDHAQSLENYYRGAGCEDCQNTGYNGHIGIFEFQTIDDELRSLIMNKASASVINAHAVNKKMKGIFPIDYYSLSLITNGITTPDELIGQISPNNP